MGSSGRGGRTRPRWGQNFLVNPGVVERILAAAGDLAGRSVIEVGPGRGALTLPLSRVAGHVTALEIDPALIASLRAEVDPSRVEILEQDAVEADWSGLGARLRIGGAPVALVANLPYESGTAILQRWLAASAAEPALARAVVMLQREVAERVQGRPGTKAYGALAVLAQSTHRVRSVMDVAPGSFRPPPSIWSRVLRLDRLDEPLFAPPERASIVSFVHAAFSHRRKQLAGVLAAARPLGMEASREDWHRLLQAHGHGASARAEEMTPAEVVTLARAAASLARE